MLCSKIRVRCGAVLVFLICTIALINAPAETWRQIIVKCAPEDLDQIRTEVGGAVVDGIDGHYLIAVPSSTNPERIESVHGKSSIEASENAVVVIPRNAPRTASSTRTTSASAPSKLGPIVDWYGTAARQAYTTQPVVAKIALKQALSVATGSGVRVAVIDSGIDLEHPTLKSVIFGGKNYVGRTSVPSFLDDPTIPELSQSTTNFLEQSAANFLEQSTTNFLEQSTTNFLEQSAANFLEQSTTNFLEQSTANFLEQAAIGIFLNQSTTNFLEGTTLPPFAGHGTMMAGLVHLVAPQARIMPFKAFDATGVGTEWNVVHAIYDAIASGADVINMSSATLQKSKIMQAAVQAAVSRGIVVVGSAGNSDADIEMYPAAFSGAIGVSALDLNDQKASFSNYGRYVDVSATGTDLISTFPGGHWASSSGTSPAAATVSGVAALVKQSRQGRDNSAQQKIENGVDPINPPAEYSHKLGKGRINAFAAVKRKADDRDD
jgi:subtilisin family serine protease